MGGGSVRVGREAHTGRHERPVVPIHEPRRERGGGPPLCKWAQWWWWSQPLTEPPNTIVRALRGRGPPRQGMEIAAPFPSD